MGLRFCSNLEKYSEKLQVLPVENFRIINASFQFFAFNPNFFRVWEPPKTGVKRIKWLFISRVGEVLVFLFCLRRVRQGRNSIWIDFEGTVVLLNLPKTNWAWNRVKILILLFITCLSISPIYPFPRFCPHIGQSSEIPT